MFVTLPNKYEERLSSVIAAAAGLYGCPATDKSSSIDTMFDSW